MGLSVHAYVCFQCDSLQPYALNLQQFVYFFSERLLAI